MHYIMQASERKGIEWGMKLSRSRMLLLIVLLLAPFSAACHPPVEAQNTASFALRILDGNTNTPLARSLVVIPEQNKTYRPDEDGRTQSISLLPKEDARWASTLPQPFGEVTILVYCQGYYPLALFHFMLKPGQDRGCIPLYLFPDDGSLNEPYALAEGPDSTWVTELLTKYQPRD